MRKYYKLGLMLLLVLSFTSCKKKDKNVENVESPSTEVGMEQQDIALSTEGIAWRDSVLKSPKTAEIEYQGTKYEVYVNSSLKYIYNTSTSEIYTGTTVGNVNAVVLKDWVVPYGKKLLSKKDAIFEATWEYSSDGIRGLIGYCDASYKLLTRARTADYVEYIYQDTTENITYRIAVTDDYILFAPLAFTYVFDVNAY